MSGPVSINTCPVSAWEHKSHCWHKNTPVSVVFSVHWPETSLTRSRLSISQSQVSALISVSGLCESDTKPSPDLSSGILCGPGPASGVQMWGWARPRESDKEVETREGGLKVKQWALFNCSDSFYMDMKAILQTFARAKLSTVITFFSIS